MGSHVGWATDGHDFAFCHVRRDNQDFTIFSLVSERDVSQQKIVNPSSFQAAPS
jgi:hypothetical protein